MKKLMGLITLYFCISGTAYGQERSVSRCDDGPSRYFDLIFESLQIKRPGTSEQDSMAYVTLAHFEHTGQSTFHIYRKFSGYLSINDTSLQGVVNVDFDADNMIQGEPFWLSISTEGEHGPIVYELRSINKLGRDNSELVVDLSQWQCTERQ